MIRVNTRNIEPFVPEDYYPRLEQPLEQAHLWLQNATGAGGDFVGWVHLPEQYDREEFARIQAAAEKIRSQSTALIVIGIGGSYLGSRGVSKRTRRISTSPETPSVPTPFRRSSRSSASRIFPST